MRLDSWYLFVWFCEFQVDTFKSQLQYSYMIDDCPLSDPASHKFGKVDRNVSDPRESQGDRWLMDISTVDFFYLVISYVFPTPDSGYERKLCCVTEKRTIQDIAVTTPSSREYVNVMLDKMRDVIFGLTYWDKDLRLCYWTYYFVFVWLFIS